MAPPPPVRKGAQQQGELLHIVSEYSTLTHKLRFCATNHNQDEWLTCRMWIHVALKTSTTRRVMGKSLRRIWCPLMPHVTFFSDRIKQILNWFDSKLMPLTCVLVWLSRETTPGPVLLCSPYSLNPEMVEDGPWVCCFFIFHCCQPAAQDGRLQEESEDLTQSAVVLNNIGFPWYKCDCTVL